MSDTRAYTVSVIGFNVTERIVLQSIFGLAARRTPKFVQFTETAGQSPDVFLVDGNDPQFLDQLRAFNRSDSIPAIVVGNSAHDTTWPVMPRPLQWSRLLKMLDEAIANNPREGARAATDAVLVVDDSLPVRKFMETKLAPFGVKVDFAENGEKAIGFSGNQVYKVVFLDVIMPGIDGYQVCKLIKSKKREFKTPRVVMLTSKGSPFDKIRGAMAGCDDYLTKPIDEDKLLETMSKYLAPAAA